MTRKPWHHSAESRHERGYGWQWTKTSARILKRDMRLCQVCLTQGRYTTATEVDHIIPKSLGGRDDDDNLQALDHACHAAKTQAEAAAGKGHSIKPRASFDASGRVIWGDR
jgi:5-methylcytosine-specific restriction protein A